jgi:hypothetical protein
MSLPCCPRAPVVPLIKTFLQENAVETTKQKEEKRKKP